MSGASRPGWTARAAVAAATVAIVAVTATAVAQSPMPSPVASAPASVSVHALTIEGAWARTSPMMDRAGAAYLVIHNSGDTDDALLSAVSPAAAVVELHETRDDGTGQLSMAPVAAIPVPAGGSAELKPGSFHIMLIELVAPLAAGDVVELTLTFQSGVVLGVAAEVRALEPMPAGSMAPPASTMPSASMVPAASMAP